MALDGAQVQLRRDKSGAPLALKIDRVALRLDKLVFNDPTTKPAFDAALEAVQLDGSGFDLEKGKRSEWTLSARSDAGETLKLAAGATADPLAADGRLDIAGVRLKRYQPYVDEAAELRIDDGQLDLGLAFKWANQELKLADVALALHSLRARLPGDKEPLIHVGALEMKGGAADLAARTASLGEIAVREVKAALRRGNDGVLNVTRTARPGKAPGQGNARPWRVDLARA